MYMKGLFVRINLMYIFFFLVIFLNVIFVSCGNPSGTSTNGNDGTSTSDNDGTNGTTYECTYSNWRTLPHTAGSIWVSASINISWKPVDGATAYTIYREVNNKNPETLYTVDTNITEKSFADQLGGISPGGTDGTIYTVYYWVTATTASGESARPADKGIKVIYDIYYSNVAHYIGVTVNGKYMGKK
jgi:hypothetical protein